MPLFKRKPPKKKPKRKTGKKRGRGAFATSGYGKKPHVTAKQREQRAAASKVLGAVEKGGRLPRAPIRAAPNEVPGNVVLAKIMKRIKLSKGTLLANLQRNPAFRSKFKTILDKEFGESSKLLEKLEEILAKGHSQEAVIKHLETFVPQRFKE